MNKPIIVNIFGGPGVGKSVVAAETFCLLKKQGIKTELVMEFAKELTWENREKALDNQIYILGKQTHKIMRLVDQVAVIVLDASILMSIIYHRVNLPEEKRLKSMEPFIMEVFHNMNNVNFLLPRKYRYETVGRRQTEKEAEQIDLIIEDVLEEYGILYYDVHLEENAASTIANIISGLV